MPALSWLVLIPFAAPVVLGFVSLLCDFQAAPRVPRPAAATGQQQPAA